MEKFNEILTTIDDAVWGIPLIVMIMAGGLLLTIRVGLLQVRKLPLALKWMVKNEEGGEGEVSSFAALCTALSATIGTGNIVGVATAIMAGGPGALFWMVVAAFLGMATKYAEGLLAVKYRVVGEDGHSLGGPFYYIEKGMGDKWKWLAKMFAFFGVCAGLLGIGTFTQVNGISSAVNTFFDPDNKATVDIPLLGEHSWSVVIASLVLAIVVALVLIGGIKSISKVSEIVVPFMAILYVLVAIIIIVGNITEVPDAIVTIVKGAFNPSAVAGGIAGTFIIAMQKGVARGIFSNESGLGSAPIAAAAAQTKEPVRQGLVSMTGTFLDTIIICSMTGISIVLTGANVYAQDKNAQIEIAEEALEAGGELAQEAQVTLAQLGEKMEGVDVTIHAFKQGLPFPEQVSAFILMLCLVFFAFTTILGWDYYSERCLEYLNGGNKKGLMVFRVLYILAVFIGPYMTVSAVWTIADIFNGMMAFPNMIALFALSGVVAKETKDFFKRRKAGEIED